MKKMKRVHFIGSGYQSVKQLMFDGSMTNLESMERAEQIYKQNGWTFHYMELEVEEFEKEDE